METIYPVSDTALILIHISRVLFAASNMFLMYSLLTVKRPLSFQISLWAGTIGFHFLMQTLLRPLGLDPFLIGYVLALLYIVPVYFIFKETLQVKFFVVFLALSSTQFNVLFFLFLEQLLFSRLVGGLVFSGQLALLLSLPKIKKHIAPHIKNILEVIDQHNFGFSLLPFFSFMLLAFYGVQRKYLLSIFIPLLLSTVIIFFSYYLLAIVIAQAKRQKQLELASTTDSLTGLFNRRYMERRIKEEYERYQQTGRPFAFLIIDIDLFKVINDKLGHAGGDSLLKAITEDLKKCIRETDVIARWGGDEFLIMLPFTHKENAIKMAERIRTVVGERTYAYEDQFSSVTLTIGVSVVQDSEDTSDNVIRKADLLMFQGKRAGRNRIVFTDVSKEH